MVGLLVGSPSLLVIPIEVADVVAPHYNKSLTKDQNIVISYKYGPWNYL